MEKQNYIGRKVKGFSFEGMINGIWFVEPMEKFIGKIGEIINYHESGYYEVEFSGIESWNYPSSLIDQYLVPEEKDETELRDQFAMQAMNGILSSQVSSDYSIRYYTPEGRDYLSELSYLIADAMLKSRKDVSCE